MSVKRPLVKFVDWGLISYVEARERQFEIQQELIKLKRENREASLKKEAIHRLIFCQHKPVYTLGKSGSESHLLLNNKGLSEHEVEFYHTNRGGDITYHGPGQLVVYPIFDLDYFKNDLHWYIRSLEEVIIQTLDVYNIKAERIKDFTGVWLKSPKTSNKKICAIGVHLSRWVSMHGLAFNINTDINYFKYIVPCGINDQDKEVTSLENELKLKQEFEQVSKEVLIAFQKVFNFELINN